MKQSDNIFKDIRSPLTERGASSYVYFYRILGCDDERQYLSEIITLDKSLRSLGNYICFDKAIKLTNDLYLIEQARKLFEQVPLFKQCLVQAIMLKRQSVQAKAMSALDEKTNELLLRNAENTALQSKMVAKLASGSSVSIETLEKSWQTIVQGIEETKAIQEEMRQKRLDGTKRLEVLKQDFVNRGIVR